MAGLRVATWNCQHGRPLPDRLGDAVAALDVDVLAMQEVDRGSRRTEGRDLAALAQESFGGALEWAGALTLDGGGEYGNALLVRGELRNAEVVRLPGPRRGRAREPRVALVADVLPDDERATGRWWTVAVTHLTTDRRAATAQLVALLDALRARPAPRVLLGDLNMEPVHLLPILTAEGYRLAVGPLTHPAHRPRRQIDHVAVAGRDCTVTVVGTLELPVGDHRALIADLHCPDLRHGKVARRLGATPADGAAAAGSGPSGATRADHGASATPSL
ncbi:MAG TPA: endonuclease/exonuclease/phosphatase family protein [Acidimicrobiales bacterium]